MNIRVIIRVTSDPSDFNKMNRRVASACGYVGTPHNTFFDWDYPIANDLDPNIPSDCAKAALSVARSCGMRVERIFVVGHNQDGNIDEIYIPRNDTDTDLSDGAYPGCPKF
jgi:hypothetical protein